MSPDKPTAERPNVIEDPVYGYRRLDPMPDESDFQRFYESAYYDLVRQGGRAPELRRLLAGGEEAERERTWLRETFFADIVAVLRENESGSRVLDVGCGQGELLHSLVEHGFDAHGIEPSDEAASLARERGLDAKTATLEELLQQVDESPPYDAVVLVNVLEHVPEPALMLRGVRRLLAPAGLCYVRVPNDFNPLQLDAQRKLGVQPWWIATPDHVNYFDVGSLCGLGRRVGLDPVDVQADFPMELFLLMGLDYIGDPSVGPACHAQRVEAELSMGRESRLAFFRSLAASGMGRNSRVLFRKVSDEDPVTLSDPLPADRHGYHYELLRREDIETLRGFRNSQMDVLRQTKPIGPGQQVRWYDEVVVPAHASPEPPMALVSILRDGEFIGYGGLTNISWSSRRAEVSFLVDPARAADPEIYRRDMSAFLSFLTELAFDRLGLNRLFSETYAFRQLTIDLLEEAGFSYEGRLRAHVGTDDGFEDSVLHGLLAGELSRDAASRAAPPR